MHQTNRRQFLSQIGAASVVLSTEMARAARQESGATYDLLIAGGRVIDPIQRLSADRDIAVANGRIAEIAPMIPHARARQVIDASGKIVTPGLIDLHGHVYDRGIRISVDPDQVGVARGVTTIVDGGSTGATTFAGFRKYVIERATTDAVSYTHLTLPTILLV